MATQLLDDGQPKIPKQPRHKASSKPARSHGRSLVDFGKLKPAEEILLNSCRAGTIAKISDERPLASTESNTIRAGFLRFLLLGGDHSAPVHEQGPRVIGAWIFGNLDIEGATIVSGIDCKHCAFDHNLTLLGCTIPGTLSLEGSRVTGIRGDRAIINGSVFLWKNFESLGLIRFVGARIGGSLSLDGANIGKKNKTAIMANRSKISGPVRMCQKFHANGKVSLVGAHIRGDLICTNGHFSGGSNHSINADRATIRGSALLKSGFVATSKVSFNGAQIGGNLDCSNGKFSNKTGESLSANSATIKRDVILSNQFQSIGEVSLIGTRVLGSIDCSNGKFYSGKSEAFCADGAYVKGDVLFRSNFSSKGEVRIIGAQIGGDLDCSDGKFNGINREALNADRCIIKGSGFLRETFKATGEVRFYGASFGADLDCRNATFLSRKNASFNGDGMHVSGAFIFMTKNATRDVSLESASVGRLVDKIDSWGNNLRIDGFIYGSISGHSFKEANSRLAWLDKQPQSMSCAPPRKTGICHRTCFYLKQKSSRLFRIFDAWIHFQSAPNNPDLERGKDFRPQPWRQLQRVLRDMGHNEDARQVAITSEDRLRYAHLIGTPPNNWWLPAAWIYRKSIQTLHYCFGKLTGYGYRPFQLLLWFGCTWLVSSTFYWWMALPPNNVFAPSNPLIFQNPEYATCLPPRKTQSEKRIGSNIQPSSPVEKAATTRPANTNIVPIGSETYSDENIKNFNPKQSIDQQSNSGNWYLCKALRKEYSGFSPPAYSLDVMLPLVDLQQEKHWAPMIRTPKADWLAELFSFDAEHITRLVVWIQTLFGWITSLLLVAIVSGLTKRRED